MMPKIRKIFIANRGEICRRIALTAKRMGIQSSCITGKKAPPSFLLSVIDHFIFVPEESVGLYLDADQMIRFALESGADAVHPGYGFLSENEVFAQKVLDAKLIWLGPSPKAIQAMAHKSDARKLALELGIPCLQGVSIPPEVPEKKLIQLAESIGYPILLKAAKGGGGKGMRVVEKSSELWSKAQQAFSEAQNYFGDGTLLLERYISQSRHIEVQILGDSHGQIITVGDRDCSLQRRYQKIVEEAPALGLTEKTREKLYEAALALCRKVSYSSCGTIEFLLDWSETSRGKDLQDFFFLEMNTRLQVEHPVSECVFGLDLVEWQIRVGRGEKLPEEFKHLKPKGHAIEARIYAEDPSKNFFPSPGKVYAFIPAQGPGVRWEMGIDSTDEITANFDPMIAKLIVSAQTRELAIASMSTALQESFFAGPVNNLEFLSRVFKDTDFKKGPIDTHFLNSKDRALLSTPSEKDLALAEDLLSEIQKRGGVLNLQLDNESKDLSKKTHAIFSRNLSSSTHDERIAVTYELQSLFSKKEPFKITYGHASYKTDLHLLPFFYASVRNGEERRYFVKIGSQVFTKTIEKASISQSGTLKKSQNQILSPVPGRILKVLVQAEEAVEAHQSLFILDSMKMEFVISSHDQGTVQNVKVLEGEQVASGQVLADFKVHT